MDYQFSEQEDGFQAIRFDGQRLELLDQRRLPAEEVWLDVKTAEQAGKAIADLVVRGAPAIGITAAYAAVLAARQRGDDLAGWQADMARLEQARPTAVNLSWAVRRMSQQVEQAGRLDVDALAELAVSIHRDDIAANRRMATLGSELIEPGAGVLTHCNTGSLATGGIGTALGVIVAGARAGRIARVFADETRPWLQGSRLTAWELARAGVDAKIVVEGAAGALMASGQAQWIITGADRITARGDVANRHLQPGRAGPPSWPAFHGRCAYQHRRSRIGVRPGHRDRAARPGRDLARRWPRLSPQGRCRLEPRLRCDSQRIG